jgi:hypothetical protein
MQPLILVHVEVFVREPSLVAVLVGAPYGPRKMYAV